MLQIAWHQQADLEYFWDTLEKTIPRWKKLQDTCRSQGVEVLQYGSCGETRCICDVKRPSCLSMQGGSARILTTPRPRMLDPIIFLPTHSDPRLVSGSVVALNTRATILQVMYTVIQSLTLDGRDMSLDYKISGFHVSTASWGLYRLELVFQSPHNSCIPTPAYEVEHCLSRMLLYAPVTLPRVVGDLDRQCA